jgi:hypothetical protein
MRQRFLNDRERHSRGNWQTRENNPAKHLFNSARGRAIKRGLTFNIEVSDIVIPTHCPVLGLPLYRTRRAITPNTPSLDRLENSKGYIKGNVWVISARANAIKRDASLEELQALVRAIKRKRKRHVCH